MDRAIADRLHDWVAGSDVAVDALGVLTDFGSPLIFYWLTLPVVLLLLSLRRVALASWVAVSVWVGGCINVGVKAAVGRDRPALDDPVATASGNSFPSGHAMLSTIVYGAVVVAVWPHLPARWRTPVAVVAATWVALIGFTRLALGVHWFTDVLGGFAMGGAWLALCTRARDAISAPSGDPSGPRR